MNGEPLPVEFQALEGRVDYVQRVNENEYHSSCPNCGGEPHADGSWPDRFVMWIYSRRGTPFGMCLRQCGYRWSPDKADANWTPEERAEFERKRAEREAEWLAKEVARLEEFCVKVEEQQVFQRCHEQMSEAGIMWWELNRRIPREWQSYLKLGEMNNYPVKNRLTTYRRTAYTIPIFGLSCRAENITLRVDNPMDSNDRYRRLYKTNMQHIYHPAGEKPKNKVVLMEGEIKAMTGAIYSRFDGTFLGVQSKSPERRILKMLDFAEVVYVAFDPDAYIPHPKTGRIAVLEVAKQIGLERTRLVIPPRDMKFDDAILQGYKFENAINMAIRPERIAQ